MLDLRVRARIAHSVATAIILAGFSACDHGPLPPVAATPAPTPTASVTAAPTEVPSPIATATPAIVGLQGEVRDRETGRPLARAVVLISHDMYATDTPPTSVPDGKVAITNDDGTFQISGVAAGTYPVEVYAPGHIAIHQQVTIDDENETLPTFSTSRLTAEEKNWLTQLNHDRAGWGAPPLVADEAVMQAARMRASTMADNGVFSHECLPKEKHCLSGPDAEIANGAFQAGGENIGAQNEGSWRDVEAGMLAEWTRCSPAARKPHSDGCPFSEDTGHFLNMVNRSYHFVGVAAYHHGRSFDVSYGPSTDYYAMEFE